MTQNVQAFSPVVCHGVWLFSESPLTVPEKAQWEQIIVEEHRLQPPCACETVFLHHRIYIALKDVVMQRQIDSGSLACYRLRPGDMFFSLANMPEWRRQDDFNNHVSVYLEPTLFTQMAETFALNHAFDLLRQEQVIHDPLLLQLGLALRAEIKNSSARFSAVYVQELAHAFAAHLLRRYAGWESQDFSHDRHLSSVSMRQVTDYIYDHLSDKLSLSALSGLVGMSPYYFARQFKQTTGKSPHQYILSLRIEQAKQQILRGASLAQITERLGFADQSHLSRAFKRVTGLSPLAFREEYRKNVPN
ncbi:AraC family transcriptional regulator [Reticulibacter mediterranei]|uniref:AraC family transcriptional regulator n=1 Tax=Reticulibacter mediterranei TaxID=2778369 RepID=A0A8J3MY65_9CHLR|nr:AraC family transcriptional regulator [Reticulibacter mediterranei]GHO90577.1 AraC family transcriptional regulator [Reticulibacter mediterranei]